MLASLRAHLPGLRALLTPDGAKNALVAFVVLRQLVRATLYLSDNGVGGTWAALRGAVMSRVVRIMLSLPSAQVKIAAGMDDARQKIESKLIPTGPGVVQHLELPRQGKSPQWILDEMSKMEAEAHGAEWKDGRISGAVYHGGEDMEHVIVEAFKKFVVSNPLHPDVFPAVRKMEAEIVSMCLRMYNNPTGAGTTTSGGTESIIMAVKTHRDWAREVKGITHPEIVIPISAHAAFDKAGAYFGIKVRHIAVDPDTRQVLVNKVRRAINRNTIMIVGSAVNFPDGCMDDIVALGALAQRRGVGLHVDCCLGSFIVPFLERAGFPVPLFDFRVPGVTSISCDTHKYGFAPKGSSVIMYRSAELRRYQYFCAVDWPGGLYASPSIAGSRPGALIAGTWAAMQYMGDDGYLESCRTIVQCARAIERRIRDEIPALYVLGKPVASVVAFSARAPTLNALTVGDIMSRKGWHLNGLANPPAVHIACTRLTVGNADQFIADLKAAVAEAQTSQEAPGGKQGNMVTLYGLSQTAAVGPELLKLVANTFLDTLYKT